MIELAVTVQIEPSVQLAACGGDYINAGRLTCDKQRCPNDAILVIRKLLERIAFCIRGRTAIGLTIHQRSQVQATAELMLRTSACV